MPHVIIVGAGISGLSCARQLYKSGCEVTVLEKEDGPGGRVRTDKKDGFLLDRGFQVLLTGYPEVRSGLDISALMCHAFRSGARIFKDGRFSTIGDPSRRLFDLPPTLVSPAATLMDKLRLWNFRRKISSMSLDQIFSRRERSTIEVLDEIGFSTNFIESFFRPFFGGVFLQRDLCTSSRFFEFVFRTFAMGDAVLPKFGMQAIPNQIASSLPKKSFRFSSLVKEVEANAVALENGEIIKSDAVVLCSGPIANAGFVDLPEPSVNGTINLYYSSDVAPYLDPILTLNANPTGFVNLMFPVNRVAPSYSPRGVSLISVTLRETSDMSGKDIDEKVREELGEWYDSKILDSWKLLKIYRIREALPCQNKSDLLQVARSPEEREGLFLAGDYLEIASLSGALRSGRLAANTVVRRLVP